MVALNQFVLLVALCLLAVSAFAQPTIEAAALDAKRLNSGEFEEAGSLHAKNNGANYVLAGTCCIGCTYPSGCCCPPPQTVAKIFVKTVKRTKTLVKMQTITVPAKKNQLLQRDFTDEKVALGTVELAEREDQFESAEMEQMVDPTIEHPEASVDEPTIISLDKRHICPICPKGANFVESSGSGSTYCCLARKRVTKTSTLKKTVFRTKTEIKKVTVKVFSVKGQLYLDNNKDGSFTPNIDTPIAFESIVLTMVAKKSSGLHVRVVTTSTTTTDANGSYTFSVPSTDVAPSSSGVITSSTDPNLVLGSVTIDSFGIPSGTSQAVDPASIPGQPTETIPTGPVQTPSLYMPFAVAGNVCPAGTAKASDCKRVANASVTICPFLAKGKSAAADWGNGYGCAYGKGSFFGVCWYFEHTNNTVAHKASAIICESTSTTTMTTTSKTQTTSTLTSTSKTSSSYTKTSTTATPGAILFLEKALDCPAGLWRLADRVKLWEWSEANKISIMWPFRTNYFYIKGERQAGTASDGNPGFFFSELFVWNIYASTQNKLDVWSEKQITSNPVNLWGVLCVLGEMTTSQSGTTSSLTSATRTPSTSSHSKTAITSAASLTETKSSTSATRTAMTTESSTSRSVTTSITLTSSTTKTSTTACAVSTACVMAYGYAGGMDSSDSGKEWLKEAAKVAMLDVPAGTAMLIHNHSFPSATPGINITQKANVVGGVDPGSTNTSFVFRGFLNVSKSGGPWAAGTAWFPSPGIDMYFDLGCNIKGTNVSLKWFLAEAPGDNVTIQQMSSNFYDNPTDYNIVVNVLPDYSNYTAASFPLTWNGTLQASKYFFENQWQIYFCAPTCSWGWSLSIGYEMIFQALL